MLHFLRHWINPICFQDTIHKCQDAFEKPLHRTDSTYQSPRMLPETLRRHILMSGFDQLTWTLLLTTAVFQKSFGTAHSQMRQKFRWAVLLQRRVYPTVYALPLHISSLPSALSSHLPYLFPSLPGISPRCALTFQQPLKAFRCQTPKMLLGAAGGWFPLWPGALCRRSCCLCGGTRQSVHV